MRETQVAEIIAGARAAGRSSLSEQQGKALLAAYGVAVPRAAVISGDGEVEAAIAALTPPFAVKVMSPDILHKSDVGGVALALPDAVAVGEAVRRMAERPTIRQARVDGYLVEEMAPAGREVAVGGLRDPSFGPMLMVGLGGVFVEVLQDVSFRLCPVTKVEAEEMLRELRAFPLLAGLRGESGVSVEAIVEILLRVGGADGLLMEEGAVIAELDINPVIATPGGAVAADARIILAPEAEPAGGKDCAVEVPRGELPVGERFRPFFEPRTVAVVGASASGMPLANTFIRRMKAFGYGGAIYPIHPKAEEIEGLPAFPSLAATPQPVDYAYVAIGAERIPGLLGEANGNVRFAQVISSGFREIAGGRELERKLVRQAHDAGCRVVGPNSLGLYSPRGGVTFPADAPTEPGHVGVISQSGGLGTDIIKRGQWRGLRFSALVSAGNSADIGPVELLEFFFQDPQTRVIGLYLEDVRDGRAFFDLLRSERATKPVVLMVGGRSHQGRAAAASHTGALASDHRAWKALARQTACAMVGTVDEFIDALHALQFLTLRPARPTKEVVLFGNGGGSSVLATDGFAAVGLDVSPFPAEVREPLEALEMPPGTSIANPIDAPVRSLQEQEGRVAGTILDIIYRLAKPEAVVMHLNLASFVGRGGVDPVERIIQAAVTTQHAYPGQAHFLLALRVDGSPELDAEKRKYREQALAVGIPVFDELSNCAHALAAVRQLELRMAARQSAGATRP